MMAALHRARARARVFRFAGALASMVLVACGSLALVVLRPCRECLGQGRAAADAAAAMTVAEGLTVSLFASEPEVRQPILVKCDDRGRLWTIQYLQYPNPAGLKRVSVDRWSRTVYDRIPEPPPRGPRGADRITILQDTDGDGHADVVKDFVTGLNLCSGLAFGHGGVFVMQVPYLLFYPDRDRDDVPDGDPEVLLEGFGMEDAQSIANHLTWGPDGWLYGVNGSTTTCNVRGVEFQQGCWRYHPLTREFELFCEGGGNTFGLTFDERGELFYSTNGGPFVHAVQGGYFYKGFGKHGPLHNLYAYGHFGPMKRDRVPGGPPTGGTIYLGDSFPAKYRGTFIAGNFLGHTASWWSVEPAASTVEARFGGVLLDAKDTWFGPTDMCTGPDGSMFICDFHDRRTAHPDPDANWDRSNGRIYRIAAAGATPAANAGTAGTVELGSLSSRELVGLLSRQNRWYAARARVHLAARRDPTVFEPLGKLAMRNDDPTLALEALWALHVSGGFDDVTAARLLGHPYEYVRSWTVRLLGDRRAVSPSIARLLLHHARSDESRVVRCQLAATARRLPVEAGLPIVNALLDRDLDGGDPRIPWLLWWDLEKWAVTDMEPVLEHFARSARWETPSCCDQLRRLVRRYAAEGTAPAYDACLRLLSATPPERLDAMHRALARGLAERSLGLHGTGQGGLFEEFAATPGVAAEDRSRKFEPLTDELTSYIERHWRAHQSDPFWIRLALRADLSSARARVLEVLSGPAPDEKECRALLGVLQEFGRSDSVPIVLRYLQDHWPEGIRASAIDVLSRHDVAAVTERLVDLYPSMPTALRATARRALFSRVASSRAFLDLVENKRIPPDEVPVAELQRVALHGDEELDAIVLRHWGNVGAGTPEERLATMRRFNNDLRAGSGDAGRGQEVFTKLCGTCHTLFGEGGKIGPDLTSANRGDRSALLQNIVDPGAVVRKDFLAYVVLRAGGQVFTGLVASQDAASITILDAKNERTRLTRSTIVSVQPSPAPLMPERLLDGLTPQELRDLFAYLQRKE